MKLCIEYMQLEGKMSVISTNAGKVIKQRPGPFGPAIDLLPKNQQLICLEEEVPACDAIELMQDKRFSQIPVVSNSSVIVGVFTWRSFATRVHDVKDTTISLIDLPIRESMEHAKFISPHVYIDTETDWGDLDYVIVGTAERPSGILCISDVFARLNDFAEAFVLIYEIEHEIRDLIRDSFSEEELLEKCEELNLSSRRPSIEVANKLKDYVESQDKRIPSVQKAIKFLDGLGHRPVEQLEDFSFSQYTSLICKKENWDRFEKIFDRPREIVDADFKQANSLRNTVFHFRKSIRPSDTDRLRRFRDRLRNDRKLARKS